MTAASDQVVDYQLFVPAYWTNVLTDTPILGRRFEIIDLDDKFIEYLESDGMYLEDTQYTSQLSDSENEGPIQLVKEEEVEEDSPQAKPSLLFPETHGKIIAAIEKLGGSVVPKVNWTVPTVLIGLPDRMSVLKALLGFYLDFC